MITRSGVLLLCLPVLWIAAACSSESPPEPVSSTHQRALLSCPTPQFGAACDPDGAAVALGECDGLCTFDKASPSGRIVCTPITDLALPNLDNYLCGAGTACTQTCNAGQCVTATAVDGTPCSGSNLNSKCGGQCTAGA